MNIVTPDPTEGGSPSLRDSELPRITCGPWTRDPQRTALGVLAILVFLAAAWLASPLWVGLMVGTVLAFTTQPLHRRLVARWGEERRRTVAGLLSVGSGVVVLALGAGAAFILGRELFAGVEIVQSKIAQGTTLTDLLGPKLTHSLARMHVDPSQLNAHAQEWVGSAASKTAELAATVLATTGGAVLSLALAMVTEYFVLLDWARLGLRLERILPIEPRHTRALFLEFRSVGRGTFVGTVGAGLIQGILATIGYVIAGVPQPISWGLATALASLLPIVGTFIVWVPIAVWLIATGHTTPGIFIAAWGLFVVSAAVDWIVRPRLVGTSRYTHPLLTVVALLGGADVLGIPGLLVGPMVMTMLLAVLTIYEREITAVRSAATLPRRTVETPMPRTRS